MSLALELAISAAKIAAVLMILLSFVPVMIWMERKAAAYIQDRRGPNRAAILGVRLGGMINSVADAIKLITKEEFFPKGANRFYFILAPFIVMFVYFITAAVIPLGDDLTINQMTITLRIADLNVGVLYIFSMASLAVYGVMLAGWSSNNKYSFLGGLRASSQMISYELALGLSVISLFMLAGSVDLNDIVRNQGTDVLTWNVIRQPLAFLLFLTASFAETNRTPFDLPEGESEIVAGYHLEYSSMKFALFMMGEYIAIMVASAVIVALFFGGWQVPFLSTQDLIGGAPEYLKLVGLGFAAVSILAGGFLVSRFRPSKYKDARRYEVLVLGVPALAAGLAVVALMPAYDPSLLPSWAGPVFAAAVQVATYLAKVFFCCFFFIWVRWTLPRFRYDQLMSFGWKGMLPLSLANLVLTALLILRSAS
ncbi:MAG TPA: complex I subunit 1 family protein [bacterium]|nr:complex I subunit 1 family protein [bacterium]